MAKNIFVKLLDTNDKISKDINAAIAEEVNKRIRKNRRKARITLRNLVPQWIREQPEMVSLSAEGVDSLAAQVGLPFGTGPRAADAIAAAVRGSLIIDFNTVNTGLKGLIEFSIQPTDFVNLLNLPNGVVYTELGAALPWLEWLLLRGNTVIVGGYSYEPAPDGRSGGGFMQFGGSWRIPPQFAGFPDNNFITRALENRNDQIEEILKGLIA